MLIVTWNMRGNAFADAKWSLLKSFRTDVAVLQEARLPSGVIGHASRRHIKPAVDRDDVVIITTNPSVCRALPDTAHGQALEVHVGGLAIFGLRSYPQLKEYYPKALLRIVESIAAVIGNHTGVPAVIAGDFNASLDQGPGRDWAPPFRRLHELRFYDALCVKNEYDERSLPCRLEHGKTFRCSKGQYRIDHLYVNRPMAKRMRDVWIAQEGWKLSDHCPVIADFRED
ncbi:MAG: endonuclease/exonuclease/phosphatase family protein [Candidatus Cybelea sp.]